MKKIIGMLLTFIMVSTMIPQNAVSAFTQDDEGRSVKAAEMSFVWHPEDDMKTGDKTVMMETVFENMGENTAFAEVKIRLDEKEASFLKQFKDKDGNLDKAAILKTDKNVEIHIEREENGDVSLVFELNRDKPETTAQLLFGTDEGKNIKPGKYKINVNEDDISVKFKDKNKNEIHGEQIELSVESKDFTIIVKNSDEDEEKITSQASLKGKTKFFDGNIPAQINVEEYRPAYENTIFWVDNKNENGIRPGADKYAAGDFYAAPKLSFSIDGESYEVLDDSDLVNLGMDTMPEITVEDKGPGKYSISVGENVLPSKVTHFDSYGDVEGIYDVKWKVIPQDIDGYSLVDITEDNVDDYPSVEGVKGWYYVLNKTVEFTVSYRIGNEGFDYEKLNSALRGNFELNVSYGDSSRTFTLEQMGEDFSITEGTSSNDNEFYGVIKNAWKYNLNGERIIYKIDLKGEENGGKVEVEGFEKGDYLSLLYDNTKVPNYGTNTDALYSGGTLYLTLSGNRTYEAKKIWLDDGTAETQSKRPQGELQLWRYRSGNSYSTASPVRDSDGNIVSLNLDENKNEQIFKSTDFKGFEDGQLPKYDSEGYRYIYVLREYLDHQSGTQGYEQVFGGVNGYEDVVEGDKGQEAIREKGNNYLYDGGVLLNRIEGMTTVSASKIWKSAAFQADLENITIELTLQSKSTIGNDEWKDTGISKTMKDFSAEIFVDGISESVPKYDEYGRLLNYRWIETAVYQGENSDENLLEQEDTEKGNSKFTLWQDGRSVEYRSEVKVEKSGNTVITNSIANEIEYEVKKNWCDEEGNIIETPEDTEVTFNMYRVINGEEMSSDKFVAKFTMDGKTEDKAKVVNEDMEISVQEVEPWVVKVKPLAEFDDEGRQYEYLLFETNGKDNYVPEYEVTKDDNGDYHAVVINRPGDGNRIMVRKNWNDNSDIAHREAVKITAYAKNDNKEINSVILGETKEGDRNDIWYDWIGIGSYEPDDVYILETYVGDTKVPLQEYSIDEDNKEEPSYNPKEPVLEQGVGDTEYTTMQYQTTKHKYEASYGMETLDLGEDKIDVFTVENRRLGNIDMMVTKTWSDGDGEKRKEIQEELKNLENSGEKIHLAMKLEFNDISKDKGYSINRTGIDSPDSVTLGSKNSKVPIRDSEKNPASSIQTVDLSQSSNKQIFYFYNLPKYDENSTIVRYDVKEVWVDEKGQEIDIEKYEKLYSIWSEYKTSYEEISYKTYENHGKPDEQAISVKNRLSDTKTLTWNKIWRDTYNYENGIRPDIYLDIYKKQHVKNENGSIDTKTSVYLTDYKWTYAEAEEGANTSYDIRNYWNVEIYNAPEYDDLGYEILYYAVEKTAADKTAFDYPETRYLAPGAHIDSQDYIGSEYTAVQLDGEDSRKYMEEISGLEQGDSNNAHFALIEKGTFVNVIKRDIEVTGQKLWSSLPSGYDLKDLPTVTFGLFRQINGVENQINEDAEPIATMTIRGDHWIHFYENGSHTFDFVFEGENTYQINDGEVKTVSAENPETVDLLPKYDEEGRLYEYHIKELSMSGNTDVDMSNVFDVSQTDVNQPINNVYESQKGELSVKKLMYLSMMENDEGDIVPKAYPAVTFELTRAYNKSDGSKSEEEVVREVTWNSSEVEDAWQNKESLMDKIVSFFTGDVKNDMDLVEKIITFEDLDIYAPNGSKYVYKVTEKTKDLGGYDTWIKEGDVTSENAALEMIPENEGIESNGYTLGNEGAVYIDESDRKIAEKSGDPAATFINQKEVDSQTVEIYGDKVWKDYGNVFDTRPDDISIELYRQADSQTGQNNAIAIQKVPESSYMITWTGKETGDTWTYKITGIPGEDRLEKYAPNGMLWKYSVKEVTENDIYTKTPGNGKTDIKTADINNQVILSDITNTILTSEPYKKNWVDEAGNKIQEDFLGSDITVGFALQVCESENTENTWYDPQVYFKEALGEDSKAYEKIVSGKRFTNEVTGNINDSVWNNQRAFGNLPKFIKKNGNETLTELDYRVVETYIKYGTHSQTIRVNDNNSSKTYTYEFTPGMFSPAYPDKNDSYSNVDTNIYNMLKTTDFSVTKEWAGDNSNIYGSREKTSRNGYDWEVSMKIFRSSDGGDNWEAVSVYDGETKEDLIVTLFGTNKENHVSSKLSGLPMTDEEGKEYSYRAREIDTDAAGGGIISEESGKNIYNGSYNVTYEDEGGTTVINTLESTRVYAEKIWNKGVSPKSLTFELKYQKEDGSMASFETPARVELNGVADITDALSDDTPKVLSEISYLNSGLKTYFEYDEWKAVWEALPEVIPGSKLDEKGKTIYKVEEISDTDYISNLEETFIEIEGEKYMEVEIENNEKVSLSVKKNWYGIDDTERRDIVVGLWHTTGTPDDSNAKKVMDDSGKQITGTIDVDKKWEISFDDLPKYDKDGNLYFYYAREISIGGVPAKERSDIFINNTDKRDEKSGDCETVISNTGRIDIAGTKTWKDNGNSYGTRPENIELILYRTADGKNETEVTAAIMKEEGSYIEWENIDKDEWNYTYKGLPEFSNEGKEYDYRVEEKITSENRMYESSQSGFDIVNTLTATIDIEVEKVWRDNDDASGDRPESVTFLLYGNDELVGRYDLTKDDAVPSDENRWKYIFEGLDEYDDDGVKIKYSVREENDFKGYDVYIDGFTIENVKNGGLCVSKKVDGNAGDKEKYFDFIVKLDDNTVDGHFGEMEFTNGISEFRLKDGESICAEGLSADIGYTVYEKEANKDGYSTSSENATGKIVAGDTVDVEFVNSRNIISTDKTNPSSREAARTGDMMNFAVPVVVATGSLAVIILLLLSRKRRRR